MNVSSSCWFRSDGSHFKVSLRHKPRRTWRILFRRENCGWSVVCLIPLQLLLRATLCGCVRVKQHSTRCAYCICVCVCVCVCEKLHTAYIFSPVIMYLMYICHPMFLPLSLSLCVSPHARSISCCFPHTDAGGGGGWVWVGGGALQWLHSCLLLGESLHRGRLHSQSRRCRKLPDQWGGRARRWADARVLHGSFFDWFLNGVVVCRTSKQVTGVISSPPALCLRGRASGSLSWAVSGDSSSPGSSQE